MGINNTAVIATTHAIKLSSSHHIWDLFHQRVAMVYNKHSGVDLLIRWTPGHIGITGNEKVDEEAKKAVRDSSSPLHRLPAPQRKALPRNKSAT